MKVGIIGAGTMGSGIAQAFAQTEGYEVCLCDINDEFAANGKKKIAKASKKELPRARWNRLQQMRSWQKSLQVQKKSAATAI